MSNIMLSKSSVAVEFGNEKWQGNNISNNIAEEPTGRVCLPGTELIYGKKVQQQM